MFLFNSQRRTLFTRTFNTFLNAQKILISFFVSTFELDGVSSNQTRWAPDPTITASSTVSVVSHRSVIVGSVSAFGVLH